MNNMDDSQIQVQFDGHTESLKELREETYRLRKALRFLAAMPPQDSLVDDIDRILNHD